MHVPVMLVLVLLLKVLLYSTTVYMQSQSNVKHHFACNNNKMTNKCLHAITKQWQTSVCMQSQSNDKQVFARNHKTIVKQVLARWIMHSLSSFFYEQSVIVITLLNELRKKLI
jgi:hypothetical protein